MAYWHFGAALVIFFRSTAALAFVRGIHRRHRCSPHEQPCLPLHLRLGDVDVDPISELRQTSYDALQRRMPSTVQIVLIGEGTHGTEEFFRIRAEVTQHLLEQRGFSAIVCEGDVQPFFELNKFVTSGAYDSPNQDLRSVLSQLFCDRFPDWMWSNVPMAEMMAWLKRFNCNAKRDSPLHHIWGMDVQSPFSSIDFIIQQLSDMGEAELTTQIKRCYESLFGYRDNMRKYGSDIFGNKIASQESEVKKALDILLKACNERRLIAQYGSDAQGMHSNWFQIIQNGHVIVASEAYHRQRIYPGHTVTWNLRSKAMMGSILRCMDHIDAWNAPNKESEVPPTRLIVWAHNSHVGDMRSTGYSSLGQISLGQLCRETFGDDSVFLIGMTTYEGTARAAYADQSGACWKGNGEVMKLRKASENSHEHALHFLAEKMNAITGDQAFGLHLRATDAECIENEVAFGCERLERFVGSCYLPQNEMVAHYTQCSLSSQFDYIIHVDKSCAIVV